MTQPSINSGPGAEGTVRTCKSAIVLHLGPQAADRLISPKALDKHDIIITGRKTLVLRPVCSLTIEMKRGFPEGATGSTET